MARKKSINDIEAQFRRISDTAGGLHINSQTGNWETGDPRQTERYKRAIVAKNRYIRNIENSPSGKSEIARQQHHLNRGNITKSNNAFFALQGRKYSQNVYMGLNAG
jgi:hypothetical protein